MLGYYKYPRNDIVEMIKNSPKTKDGYYYIRSFPYLNNTKGKLDGEKDSNYYYPREFFSNKMVFNDYEIESYLSKKKTNLNVDRMQSIDQRIKDTINEFIDYGLDENIPGYEFNLNELIDTTIYFYNIKN